jgi:hypothetical protein
VKWLIENHADADTAIGDVAREVQRDTDIPTEGERRDVRRYLEEEWCAGPDFLVCFEEAWRLYEPSGSPADHPFVTFLLKLDLRSIEPLSMFARGYANLFPPTGDREAMRAVLEEYVGEEDTWDLSCFDVAWHKFRPTCEEPGCPLPVDVQMSVCAVHVLAELL